MGKINVGLVGYGYSGRKLHAQLIKAVPDLYLYAVHARHPDTLQQAAADHPDRVLELYTTYESLLEDLHIHLVVIATPHKTHAALAIQALEAKKHVLVDKLMCLNMQEFEHMRATAAKNNVILTVFQNRRFDGDFLTVEKLLKEQSPQGTVRWLEMAWHRWGRSTKAWKSESIEQGGGTFLDLAAHMIDQACLLFPEGIRSVYGHFHLDDAHVDTHAMAIIDFESGRTAVIETATSVSIKKPRFTLAGEKGTFVKFGVDPQEEALLQKGTIADAKENEDQYGYFVNGSTGERINVPTLPGNWVAFYENLARAIQGKEPLKVSLDSVQRSLHVLFAAVQSALTGKAIVLNLPALKE